MAGRQAILETLERHCVEYVLIGGAAAQTHGWRGVTRDVDVTPSRNRDNLDRLAGALTELGARFRVEGYEEAGFDPPGGLDFRTFEGQISLAFVTDHGLIDVALVPDGTEGYEDLVKNARRLTVADTTVAVPVASADDVLRSKEQAGRAKDRAQLAAMRIDLARHEREEGDKA